MFFPRVDWRWYGLKSICSCGADFCSNVKTELFCFLKSPFFCFTLNYVLVTWTWRVWCRAGWGNLGSALFQYKLCRVSRVQVGPKGVPFLVTHDGRTVRYPDPLVRVNDSIYLDIATGKMKDFIKFDSGEIPWYSLQQETRCVLGLYMLYLIFLGKKYVCCLLCTSLLCFWGNLIVHSNAWPWGIQHLLVFLLYASIAVYYSVKCCARYSIFLGRGISVLMTLFSTMLPQMGGNSKC